MPVPYVTLVLHVCLVVDLQHALPLMVMFIFNILLLYYIFLPGTRICGAVLPGVSASGGWKVGALQKPSG